MGRPRQGWKLREPREGRDHYTVRFTDRAGNPREYTTGKSDPGEAAVAAADIYARSMTTDATARVRINPLLALDEHLSQWLASLETTHDEKTCATYTLYAKKFLTFFGDSVSRITTARMGDYQRKRLGEVTKKTLNKERSAMNGFLIWCEEQGLLTDENRPRWPRIPVKATGKRSGPQRENPVDVTPAQVNAFLAALPLWSRPRGGASFAIRARFEVAYETGLRPATLDELSVPRHWRPGATEILIDDEIDKARFGRRVPISARCAAALERTAMALGISSGLIFGKHDYRDAFDRAATAAGMPDGFAPYDLRHGRAGHLLDAGATMRAVAYILGHKKLTTTDRYLRAQKNDARAALMAADYGDQSGTNELNSESTNSEDKNMNDISAKEEGRTPTSFRTLEPESSEDPEKTYTYDLTVDPDGPVLPGVGSGFGDVPETIQSASRYLAALRADWDVFDALALAADEEPS
jgi:integrase